MERLFTDLLTEIEVLRKNFELAPTAVNEKYAGKRPSRSDLTELEEVLCSLDEAHVHLEELKAKPIENHKKEVSRWLAFFRELPEGAYGEFLFRKESNEVKYLNAIESAEFKNFGKVIDTLLQDSKISDLGRAKILHETFGIACDKSSNGEEYKITNSPVCRFCQSKKVYSWEPAFPPEVVDVEIAPVTHFHWKELTEKEKEKKIKLSIEPILANKKAYRII